MLKILVLGIFCFGIQARAGDAVPVQMQPSSWTDDLHLYAGAGVNGSTYSERVVREEWGYGLNIKTDLGYLINPRWAVDLSSSLKFNRVADFVVWDTLLTLGVRYHITVLDVHDADSVYVRAYLGVAPSVFEIQDRMKATNSFGQNADRLIFDGRVIGASLGWMKASSPDTTLFYEVNLSVQDFRREKAIKDDNEIPTVVSSRLIDGGEVATSLSFIIGFRAF